MIIISILFSEYLHLEHKGRIHPHIYALHILHMYIYICNTGFKLMSVYNQVNSLRIKLESCGKCLSRLNGLSAIIQ